MAKLPKQDELLDFSFDVPKTGWMHTPTEFKEGMYCYGTKPKNLEVVGMPNGHDWSPADEDWHLPEGWKDIVLNGMEDLMKKYRSFKLYMDVCVRCGACADKCHFYQGTGDPKNMPVVRAELLRSVYRRYFTTVRASLLGEAGGRARPHRRTSSRSGSLLLLPVHGMPPLLGVLPLRHRYQAEITAHGPRAAEPELGLGHQLDSTEPVCQLLTRTGNHVGLQPHDLHEQSLSSSCEDLRRPSPARPYRPAVQPQKGHEILFVAPSGDVFAEPGIVHVHGVPAAVRASWGWTTRCPPTPRRAATSAPSRPSTWRRRLNAKMYAEAKRLGCEVDTGRRVRPHVARGQPVHGRRGTAPRPKACWRFPRRPSPARGSRTHGATKMVHIAEFTADLLSPRQAEARTRTATTGMVATYPRLVQHRPRAMGLLEEPRYMHATRCATDFARDARGDHPREDAAAAAAGRA